MDTRAQRQGSVRRGEAGFSLPELLVVCIIIAIACTIGVTAWNSNKNNSETLSAARLTHDFLIQARMLAVYRGLNEFLVIDPTAKQVSVYEDSGTTKGSFDAGDKVVMTEPWAGSVSLAMPASISSLSNPLGGTAVTSAWSLPAPDAAARWGSTLYGVMATPRGLIQSAASTPATIASGVIVFSDATGQIGSVGVRGQFGAVKSFVMVASSWWEIL